MKPLIIERIETVRHLGFPNGLSIKDRRRAWEGENQSVYRSVTSSNIDGAVVVSQVNLATGKDTVLLDQHDQTVTLIKPGLDSLGVVVSSPAENDPDQNPLIEAVSLMVHNNGGLSYQVVASTRLRPTDLVALGNTEDDRFNIKSVLRRGRPGFGSDYAVPVMVAPTGAR